MRCENCNNQIPNNATVCSYCNTPITTNFGKVCPNCNTPIGEKDTFCMGCGTKVAGERVVVDRMYEDRSRVLYDDREYTRRKKGNGVVAFLLVIILVAAVGLGAYIMLNKDDKKEVGNGGIIEDPSGNVAIDGPVEENVLMLSINNYDSEVSETTSTYILSGKATATTENATVSINDQVVQNVAAGGKVANWSAQLNLSEGTNVFDVKLADNSGHIEERTVKITRKTVKITPVTPPTQPNVSGGYLFPSDTRYITVSDLAGRSKDEVALIRNEIYARHGYKFKTKKYQDYFNSKSWYTPRSNFSESQFNSIEKANKDFIVNYEKSMGWR